MSEKPLPSWVADALRVNGWKAHEGRLIPKQSWSKNGVLLSIYASGRSKDFHINHSKMSVVSTRLVDAVELSSIISRGE